MSILNWVKNGKLGIKPPNSPLLPNPIQIEDEAEAQITTSCNKEIEKDDDTPTRKRKRGEYGSYSPETQSKMAKYCVENGPTKTARHFSKTLGRNVNESTIRSIRKLYFNSPTMSKDLKFPHSPRGRPLKLGAYDDLVKFYVRKLRVAGGVVNSQIVMAGGRGVILFKDKTLLKENGGPIDITKDWALSLLKRMGFSKRKGTNGVKHFPDDFEDIKSTFNKRIRDNVQQFNIPDELIINRDETGVNLVPCGEWTMHGTGAKQVPIKGVDDKRQITAVLAATKSGVLLPTQLLYQGLTDKCHPSYNFPKDCDIFHSENHWSNVETMHRYIEKIIVPYVERVRDELDLPLRQKALCVFDLFYFVDF